MIPELYHHQTDLVTRVRAARMRGARIIILQAATGAGKTNVAAYIVRQAAEKSSDVLFMVHRRKLVNQISDRLIQFEVNHGVFMRGEPRDHGARIQVASRDTLLSRCVRNEWIGMPPAQLVIVDECVTGDTIIRTDVGDIPISSVLSLGASAVMSYDGKEVLWKRIVRFIPQGMKRSLEITLLSGKTIRCTANHPIMTNLGWVRAGSLTISHKVFCLVNADAEPCSEGFHQTKEADKSDSSQDIKILLKEERSFRQFQRPCRASSDKEEQKKNGMNVVATSLTMRHCVRAGAESELDHGNHIAAVITDSAAVTINDPQNGTSCLPTSRDKRFSERFSEIHPSATQVPEVPTQESVATTVDHSKIGLNTRQTYLLGCDHISGHTPVVDMVRRLSHSIHDACHASNRYMPSSKETALNELAENGSIPSETSDSLGGFVMMEAQPEMVSLFTRKDIQRKTLNLRPNGSVKTSVLPASITREVTRSSGHWHQPGEQSSKPWNRMSLSVCNTNFDPVVSVRVSNITETVFDIEVEDTHCFFANGMLIHNCHHAADPNSEYRRILTCYPDATILLLSATPVGPDGKGLGPWAQAIECMAPTSQLVKQGYLVPVKCYAPDRKKKGRKFLRGIAGDLVESWKTYGENRPTVLFCSRVAHSQAAVAAYLEAGIKAVHVDADTPDDVRDRAFEGLETGDVQLVSNVGIVGEGVDIPCLGCVQWFMDPSGRVKWLQGNGRIMRPFEGKHYGVLIDHAGACFRHGFPDEDTEWTLEGNADEAFAKKHKAGETEKAFYCKACELAYHGTEFCPQCGRKPVKPPRSVFAPIMEDSTDELLVEAERNGTGVFSDESKIEHWKRCVAMTARKGGTFTMASCIYKRKYNEWPENGFPLLPDWSKRRMKITDVYPGFGRIRTAMNSG